MAERRSPGEATGGEVEEEEEEEEDKDEEEEEDTVNELINGDGSNYHMETSGQRNISSRFETNQPTNTPASIYPPTGQTTNQPINKPTSRLINQSIN